MAPINKIELASYTSVHAVSDRIGYDLARQIHLYGSVDGDDVVLFCYHTRIACVGGRMEFHQGIVGQEFHIGHGLPSVNEIMIFPGLTFFIPVMMPVLY